MNLKSRINDHTLFNAGLYLYFVFAYLSESFRWGNLVIVASLLLMIMTKLRKRFLSLSKSDMNLLAYIVVFAAYACLSRLWAESPRLTINKSNALVFIVAAMAVIVVCKYDELSIETVLKVIMYGGYTVGLYILFRYGLRGILTLMRNEQRLGAVLNANTLGMCVSYAMLINFYFISYERRFRIQYLLMLPMLVILIATGSRKAVLILIAGVFALFVMKNFNNRKALNSLLKVLLGAILLAVVIYFVLKLPALSKISGRLKSMFIVLVGGGTRSTDGWLRVQYVKLGLQLFARHPILGIGLGNANLYTSAYWGHDHYLHNNYVELLATLGIVGTLLYYSMYLYILSIFWKKRKSGRDRDFDICMIILLVRLVMDYGAVFFYNKETYIFLLLFWIEARKLKAGSAALRFDPENRSALSSAQSGS